MHTLSKVYTLLKTFSRLLWGIICDKFKFKIPYLITYFIVVCFAVLSYAGHIILFPNLIHTKFGVENSVILLGICGIFAGISSLIGPILTYFINDLENYLITYLLGVAPSVVSLILTIIIKTESFDKNVDKLITNKNERNEDDKLVDGFTYASEKNEAN